jgi:hypothetical protein
MARRCRAASGPAFVADTAGRLTARVSASNDQGSDARETAPAVVAPPLAAPVVEALAVTPSGGRVGDVFTAVVSASGEPQPGLAYRWRLDGGDMEGATGASIVPAAPGLLAVTVTASSEAGVATRESEPVEVAPALAAPSITGAAIDPSEGRVGDTFAAVATIGGNPEPVVGYVWLLDGVVIEGATGPSVTGTAVGSLSLRLTAENALGAASVETAPAAVAAALAAPAVSGVRVEPGSGRVGDAFEALATVSGNPFPQVSFQWLLDGLALSGATDARYDATAAGSLSVRVVATSALGSDSATSAPVPVEAASGVRRPPAGPFSRPGSGA